MSEVCVSIIVPVYNVEKYLKRCMDSIISQSMREIEIICVEDCSSDSSLSILNEYEDVDDRIKIICNPVNKGLSYSRNIGMSKARGEYIWFVDSDDWLKNTDVVESVYVVAKESDADIVSFDIENCYESDELRTLYSPIERNYEHDYTNIIKGSDVFCDLMEKKDFYSMVFTYVYKKSFLDECDLKFPLILHEDFVFSIEAILLAKRIKQIPLKLYCYYRRGGSITTKANSAYDVRDYACVLESIFLFVNNNTYDDRTGRAIAEYLSMIVKLMICSYFESLKRNQEIVFYNSSQAVRFYMLLENEFPFISRSFDHDFIMSVKKSESIIVYGAGYVAKGTIKFLEMIGIKNYKIAVTKSTGEKEYEIADNRLDREKSYVLVSAARDKAQEMVECLKTLGFSHYRIMT